MQITRRHLSLAAGMAAAVALTAAALIASTARPVPSSVMAPPVLGITFNPEGPCRKTFLNTTALLLKKIGPARDIVE